MSKKIDNPGRTPAKPEADLAESSPQIWLAGLGAFAKAQQQGGKVFESLVQEGLELQRKTQEAAQAQMAEATQKLSAMTGGLGARAAPAWDKLEGIFEQRVSKALQRLNMVSREELVALERRMESLEEQLRTLGHAPARPRGKASATSPPAARRRKPAA